MAKKIFTYRGKTLEELQQLSDKELIILLPARERRTLLRGATEDEKVFIENVAKGSKKLKTHCRNIIIMPNMVGLTIEIHNGKAFERIEIQPEMIGHRLGEFALSRKRLVHNSPGVGSTKSSGAVSAK